MSDLLVGLNSEQKRAVVYSGTPLLLLAGAGSGKLGINTPAAYFVENNLAQPSEILLLTFTNKAAGEMKQRMTDLIKSSRQKSKTDNIFAGTFHSFCCRVLRQDGTKIGLAPNFAIYDSDDQEI
jgi:DNA helicase-2/ATP-dependent DNA helicase PcrA